MEPESEVELPAELPAEVRCFQKEVTQRIELQEDPEKTEPPPLPPQPIAKLHSEELTLAIEERVESLGLRIVEGGGLNAQTIGRHLQAVDMLVQTTKGKLREIEGWHLTLQEIAMAHASRLASLHDKLQSKDLLRVVGSLSDSRPRPFSNFIRALASFEHGQKDKYRKAADSLKEVVRSSISVKAKQFSSQAEKQLARLAGCRENLLRVLSRLKDKLARARGPKYAVLQLQQIATLSNKAFCCLEEYQGELRATWKGTMREKELQFMASCQEGLMKVTECLKLYCTPRDLAQLEEILLGSDYKEHMEQNLSLEKAMTPDTAAYLRELLGESPGASPGKLLELFTSLERCRVVPLLELSKHLFLKLFEVETDEGVKASAWRRASLLVAVNRWVYLMALNSEEVYKRVDGAEGVVRRVGGLQVSISQVRKGVVFNSRQQIRVRMLSEDSLEELLLLMTNNE